MVLSSWQSHCESSPGSFDECRLSAGWPPILKPSQLTWTVSLPEMAGFLAPTICIHHRHLLLLSPKADTHFTVPRRVEGWVDLVGWLHTENNFCLWQFNQYTVTHTSTIWAQLRFTSLNETNALPLRQTTNWRKEGRKEVEGKRGKKQRWG